MEWADGSLNVIAHTMGSFIGTVSQQNIVMLILGMFVLWAVLSHPNIEFTYYRSTKPFPNQRLARIVFHAAGIVLMLGGLWGLWIDLHVLR